MSDPPKKKPGKRPFSSMDREFGCRHPKPPTPEQPPPKEPASPLAEAAEQAQETLRETFRKKGDFRSEVKRAMKGGRSGRPMRRWTTKQFKLTPDQAKREFDPRNQMSKLMDTARNRPFVSAGVMAIALLIFVADLTVLMRNWRVEEWLPISIEPLIKRTERRWNWDRRGSSITYLTHNGTTVVDEAAASAIDGKDKLPADMERPGPGKNGLVGILTPKELAGAFKGGGVSGLNPSNFRKRGLKGLSRTQVVQGGGDFKELYRFSGDTDQGPNRTAFGVYLGAAGDRLENYAALAQKIVPTDGFLGPDGKGKSQKVPKDLTGAELVAAMIDDDLMGSLKDYAKNGTWSMHKAKRGEVTARHELSGLVMTSNQALFQLLDTKRATDRALFCQTCGTERRIHNNRATFFGEKHE